MHKAFLEKLSSATLKFKWGTILWELLTLGKSRNFYCEFYDGKSSFHFWASFYFLSINYFSNFNEEPTENCHGKLGSLFTYYYYFIIIILIIIIIIIIIINQEQEKSSQYIWHWHYIGKCASQDLSSNFLSV